MKKLLHPLNAFWNEHPGLYYGLILLLGMAFGFTTNYFLLVPFSILLATPRFLPGLALFLIAIFYIQLTFKEPTISKEGVQGVALFEVTHLSQVRNHFATSYLYKGTLHQFSTLEIGARPCTILMKKQEAKPLAGKSYLIDCKLFKSNDGHYYLKTNKHWQETNGPTNLSQWRYLAKTSMKEHIFSKIKSTHAASLITGMFTGEIQNPMLQFALSRLGLQHLLAISGFHFAILTGMMSLLLRPLLSPKKAACLLILLTTLYFLFIGPTPSVARSWVATILFLGAQLFEKESHALNRLGLALIIVILIDPFSVLHVGFQLSFAATAGILLFYPLLNAALQKVWKKRDLSTALQLNLINKIGLLFLTFFREAIALNIAVLLATLPILLFVFHKWPLYSLLYNLAFPFLATFSMLLLVISLALDLIFLGTPLHLLNEAYTNFILKLVMHAPKKLEFILTTSSLTATHLVFYLTILFGVFIFLRQKQHTQKDYLIQFNYL